VGIVLWRLGAARPPYNIQHSRLWGLLQGLFNGQTGPGRLASVAWLRGPAQLICRLHRRSLGWATCSRHHRPSKCALYCNFKNTDGQRLMCPVRRWSGSAPGPASEELLY